MRIGQKMLIPTPELIRSVIESLQQGTSLSMSELRKALANRASAEVTCPVTTSLYLKKLVLAEWLKHQSSASNQQEESSEKMSPFWRVIDPTMPLFKKLDSVIQEFIMAQRGREGI